METYVPRFFIAPKQSFFLFGPRGTGKSTFLKQHYPNALWIDLLKPDVFRAYAGRPERLVELVHGNPEKKFIVIDEVQKVPDILSVVHSLIEEKKGRTFILTGSSARKLKRTGIDLLAGRVLLRTLHSFMLSELTAPPAFAEVLQFGLLPIVVASENPQDVLNAYVSLYVREEVQIEGLVRNIGNFSRFLEAASFSHAAALNISNIARECGVERKVVEAYIQILEDILLAFKLPVFTKRAQRALATHPKFYFFDAGVFQSLRPQGPLDRPEEIAGAALEGLVAQHLRAWNAYKGNPYEIFFWRSRGGLEVDFVLYGKEGIYAIEVKNTKSIRPADLRGLTEFRKDYPRSQTIFLYRGDDKLLINHVSCIPCEAFLKRLSPSLDLSAVFHIPRAQKP
ncbi:MAG: AAA family ATPase [candidate division KSB1 bacterium]|nr:AAA family ATPase [candidate division KSB1 bacterium]MDZ7368778.1 AAA family ATPase [candidate division KSB1 bacterium]MDZ7406588.1 AAA family ATPase [candidate division KSB1 bacterium]